MQTANSLTALRTFCSATLSRGKTHRLHPVLYHLPVWLHPTAGRYQILVRVPRKGAM